MDMKASSGYYHSLKGHWLIENEFLILYDMTNLSNVIFPEESESVLRFLIGSIIFNLSAF